jgi:hypothetical protein
MMETDVKGMEPEGARERAGEPGPTRDEALQHALEGALFPLSREHLVLVARENDAPAGVLSLLGGLPAGRYGALDEVVRRLPDGV